MAEQIRVGDVLRLKAKAFRELLGDTATVTRVHTQIRRTQPGVPAGGRVDVVVDLTGANGTTVQWTTNDVRMWAELVR